MISLCCTICENEWMSYSLWEGLKKRESLKLYEVQQIEIKIRKNTRSNMWIKKVLAFLNDKLLDLSCKNDIVR